MPLKPERRSCVRYVCIRELFSPFKVNNLLNSILLNCVCACVHVWLCEWVRMYEFKCVCGEDVIHIMVYLHSSIDSQLIFYMTVFTVTVYLL